MIHSFLEDKIEIEHLFPFRNKKISIPYSEIEHIDLSYPITKSSPYKLLIHTESHELSLYFRTVVLEYYEKERLAKIFKACSIKLVVDRNESEEIVEAA